MRTVRLFVSSPADTSIERKLIDRVAEQLNGEAAGFVRFEVLRWETRVYGAHDTFQNLIPDAAACDIVVAIFRQRLGLPLPADFRRMPAEAPYNGDPYASGTAFEVLTALAAKAADGKPDVFVFRQSDKTPPTARLDQPEAYEEALRQWQSLEAFFARFFHTPQGEFIRAYNLFVDSDDFRREATVLLRDWMEENVLHQKAVVWPYKTKGSPFRSLQPFDARHAAVYFGRDRKVGRALDEIANAARRPDKIPFLLIVGPSGAGKSSMMRAGVAPRLTTPGIVPDVDGWRIAVLRIGDADPFAALAAALLVKGEDDDEGAFGPALPELEHQGFARPAALAAALETAGPATAASMVAILDDLAQAQAVREGSSRTMRVDLLLLVDQFESIFVPQLADDRRALFAALLQALCRTRRIWVVATLRADLYHRFLTRGAFIELADRGAQYNLAPPGEAELTEIVRKSGDAAGLVYELDPATGERLDDRILRDAHGENMLPLLQFALDRLFIERVEVDEETRLTHAAYEAMGGLDGAIDQTADRVLQTFDTADPQDKAALERLPRLLRSLAVPINAEAGGARSAGTLSVRSVPLARVAADPPTQRLVDALIEARILVASVQAAEAAQAGAEIALVGVAHQKVFESWKRARAIIREHAEFFLVRDDVERQVAAWAEHRQDASYLLPSGPRLVAAEGLVDRYAGELDNPLTPEFVAASGRLARRKQRRLRMFAAAMGILAVAATGGLVAATYYSFTAQRNYDAARSTIDEIMGGMAKQLSELEGIRSETVNGAFEVLSKAVEKLRLSSGGDPKLEHSKSDVLFNFAKLYQKANQTSLETRYAEESLAIRSRLTGYEGRVPAGPALLGDLAPWFYDLTESLEQMAFLERRSAPQRARDRYDISLAIRRQLVRGFPARTDWTIGVSKSLVGLGDMAKERAAPMQKGPARDQVLAVARAHYQEALANSFAVFRQDEHDNDRQRELSWAFMKLGDVEILGGNFSVALDHYGRGVCLRRRLVESGSGGANNLWRRDLGFAYEKRAAARCKLRDFAGCRGDDLRALIIRESLYRSDPGNVLYIQDLAGVLHQAGEAYQSLDKPRLAGAFYHAAEERWRAQAALSRGKNNRALKEAEINKAANERMQAEAYRRALAGQDVPESERDLDVAAELVRFQQEPDNQRDAECWQRLPAAVAAQVSAAQPPSAAGKSSP